MQFSEFIRVKGSTLFTVSPETMLSDCVMVMAEHDIGSLIVMDRGRLAGMLTFREVIRVLARRQAEHRNGPTPPVAAIVMPEVMNPRPPVVGPVTDDNEQRPDTTGTTQSERNGVGGVGWLVASVYT